MAEPVPYQKICNRCRKQIILAKDGLTGNWRAYDNYKVGQRHSCTSSVMDLTTQVSNAANQGSPSKPLPQQSSMTTTIEQPNQSLPEILGNTTIIISQNEKIIDILGDIENTLFRRTESHPNHPEQREEQKDTIHIGTTRTRAEQQNRHLAGNNDEEQ